MRFSAATEGAAPRSYTRIHEAKHFAAATESVGASQSPSRKRSPGTTTKRKATSPGPTTRGAGYATRHASRTSPTEAAAAAGAAQRQHGSHTRGGRGAVPEAEAAPVHQAGAKLSPTKLSNLSLLVTAMGEMPSALTGGARSSSSALLLCESALAKEQRECDNATARQSAKRRAINDAEKAAVARATADLCGQQGRRGASPAAAEPVGAPTSQTGGKHTGFRQRQRDEQHRIMEAMHSAHSPKKEKVMSLVKQPFTAPAGSALVLPPTPQAKAEQLPVPYSCLSVLADNLPGGSLLRTMAAALGTPAPSASADPSAEAAPAAPAPEAAGAPADGAAELPALGSSYSECLKYHRMNVSFGSPDPFGETLLSEAGSPRAGVLRTTSMLDMNAPPDAGSPRSTVSLIEPGVTELAEQRTRLNSRRNLLAGGTGLLPPPSEPVSALEVSAQRLREAQQAYSKAYRAHLRTASPPAPPAAVALAASASVMEEEHPLQRRPSTPRFRSLKPVAAAAAAAAGAQAETHAGAVRLSPTAAVAEAKKVAAVTAPRRRAPCSLTAGCKRLNCIVRQRGGGEWVREDFIFAARQLPLRRCCTDLLTKRHKEAMKEGTTVNPPMVQTRQAQQAGVSYVATKRKNRKAAAAAAGAAGGEAAAGAAGEAAAAAPPPPVDRSRRFEQMAREPGGLDEVRSEIRRLMDIVREREQVLAREREELAD